MVFTCPALSGGQQELRVVLPYLSSVGFRAIGTALLGQSFQGFLWHLQLWNLWESTAGRLAGLEVSAGPALLCYEWDIGGQIDAVLTVWGLLGYCWWFGVLVPVRSDGGFHTVLPITGWHMWQPVWKYKHMAAVMNLPKYQTRTTCVTCLRTLDISVLKDDGQTGPVPINVQALDG